MAEMSDGVRLALLLLAAFESMVDEVVDDLARQGHPGVTANLEFALGAIGDGADSAAELGRRLDITRQAAAKTIAALEDHGYVERADDPADARRKRLRVTPRGEDMTAKGAAVFDRLRTRWAQELRPGQAEAVEDALTRLVAADSPWLDRRAPAPGPGRPAIS